MEDFITFKDTILSKEECLDILISGKLLYEDKILKALKKEKAICDQYTTSSLEYIYFTYNNQKFKCIINFSWKESDSFILTIFDQYNKKRYKFTNSK